MHLTLLYVRKESIQYGAHNASAQPWSKMRLDGYEEARPNRETPSFAKYATYSLALSSTAPGSL